MLTECPNNVSVSILPAEPGPPANKRRRLKVIQPLEEFPQLTTTTGELGPPAKKRRRLEDTEPQKPLPPSTTTTGEYFETFMIIAQFMFLNYRSLAKIRPPFLHCTSSNERGMGVYTRITQFYSKICPPR